MYKIEALDEVFLTGFSASMLMPSVLHSVRRLLVLSNDLPKPRSAIPPHARKKMAVLKDNLKRVGATEFPIRSDIGPRKQVVTRASPRYLLIIMALYF